LEPLFNLDSSKDLDKTLFFEPLKTKPQEEDCFKDLDDIIRGFEKERKKNKKNKKKHSSSIPQEES
jgi:hypothetical protein